MWLRGREDTEAPGVDLHGTTETGNFSLVKDRGQPSSSGFRLSSGLTLFGSRLRTGYFSDSGDFGDGEQPCKVSASPDPLYFDPFGDEAKG